jgi:glycosyltransferase involved in cell wall biosynthesis
MITIFTPSFADESNTNAQNLTTKEVVARLSPDEFRVEMLYSAEPDPRIARRPNTRLIRWQRHGNTVRLLAHCLFQRPSIYFFPREGSLEQGFLWMRRRLWLSTSLVTYVVGTQEKGPASSVLEDCIRQADAVVGNSLYCSETICQRYGVTASTIYDGISRQIFYPTPGRSQERLGSGPEVTVLYAGSFQERKRPHLVIREAARWPNVRFRMAGQGEEEAPCRALAQELGVRNVEFLGHFGQQALGEEMRRADIFLFPSVIEGHPQVLGQAAACGLPCVAMDVYRPDYVVSGVTGFLVRSEAELSEKLATLLTNLELRQSMSAAAVQHSLKFEWDAITEQWARLFCSVARRSGATREDPN